MKNTETTGRRTAIRTGKIAYSFEYTMYGTFGPERTVWDEEAREAMNRSAQKRKKKRE